VLCQSVRFLFPSRPLQCILDLILETGDQLTAGSYQLIFGIDLGIEMAGKVVNTAKETTHSIKKAPPASFSGMPMPGSLLGKRKKQGAEVL
jgi:hypothetical protein